MPDPDDPTLPREDIATPTPYLLDTTLRDGQQAPGVALTIEERVAITEALAAAGVGEIELGIPAIGDEEQDAIRACAQTVTGVRTSVWCRAREDDLTAAAATGVDAVHLSLPVSTIQLKNLGRDRRWVLGRLHALLPVARERFAFVSIGAQDASRTSLEFLHRVATTAAAFGADRLRLADTVGAWDPWQIGAVFAELIAAEPDLAWGLHTHNDLGLATANSLAALRAGASCVDVTVGGLGERAGNAALEQVAMAGIQAGCDCGIDTPRLAGLCDLVANASGRAVPVDRPLVGADVFRHHAGIHVHAMLRDTRAYEPFPPERIGRTRPDFVLGARSGGAAVRHACHRLGIALNEDLLPVLLARVRAHATRHRRCLEPDEILRLYRGLERA